MQRAPFLLAPLSLLFFAACATAPKPPPADTPRPELRSKLFGPFGAPRKLAAFGVTRVVERDGYILEHSDELRAPIWVEHHVSAAELGSVENYHRPRWKADPNLPQGARAEDSDYEGYSGEYDRGHMAPNADFGTKKLRDDTFYLSNTVPQDSRNNQGIWQRLEAKVRKWIEARGEAYVITGAVYSDHTRRLGSGVVIPDRLYKIVLAPKSPGDTAWEAIAFVVDNKSYESPFDHAALIESIDDVESETGIDFFPALDEAIERERPALWSP